MLQCPICQENLVLKKPENQSAFYSCRNNHSFDCAKEGYVNLLPVQKKRSKNPGDSHEMMLCRQSFLSAGHYQFLVDCIFDELKDVENNKSDTPSLLDIGCGEGYYGQQIKLRFPSIAMSGLDIAKSGIRMAAKRRYADTLCVASAYDLPFTSGQFDYALSIFSPISPSTTARVLKPGGKLICVGPNTTHLHGLAKHIYTTPRPHKGNFKDLDTCSELKIHSEKFIQEELTVAGPNIYDLFTMTPYYWSAKKEQQENIKRLETLKTEASFIVRTYLRC